MLARQLQLVRPVRPVRLVWVRAVLRVVREGQGGSVWFEASGDGTKAPGPACCDVIVGTKSCRDALVGSKGSTTA